MSQETILVTGAAGGVGSTAHSAIATLREHGHRVRAMLRKLDARADTLRDMGMKMAGQQGGDAVGHGVILGTRALSPMTYADRPSHPNVS
jgi:nucleoside-diphosphate-sugar epimerase